MAAERAERAQKRQVANAELAALRAQFEAAREAAAAADTAEREKETARMKEGQEMLQKVKKDLTASKRIEARLNEQKAKNLADIAGAEKLKQEMEADNRK